MDGSESMCVDDLILKTNTARVLGMDLGSKPLLAEIGSDTSRSGKRVTLPPSRPSPLLQRSPKATYDTFLPETGSRQQSYNRVDEAVLRANCESF